MTDLSAHEHSWRTLLHADQCHAVRASYTCECGARRDIYRERDPKESMAQLWMLDDDGCPRCPRCAELMRGDEPAYQDVVVSA